ncbi:hypothetical protein B0A52_09753 [Exophiala mesophila]|uniref:Xylanolytic transcriptional activator regulatory domain-containing protein n=1 Tax=Exophiala mesophila TaxID=212818 RepID=A0A438MSZ2_EXOME|nr:hypothetical protein B0A52_09753 [Exophiala mesophila]
MTARIAVQEASLAEKARHVDTNGEPAIYSPSHDEPTDVYALDAGTISTLVENQGQVANHNTNNQSVGTSPDIVIPPAMPHLRSAGLYSRHTPLINSNSTTLESPNQGRTERASIVSNDASQNWRASEASPTRYVVDPGFIRVYGPEHDDDARNQAMLARKVPNLLDVSQPYLQQSFAETYFEYCYTWCPVLDKGTWEEELLQSPLLDNALALLGSHVKPPMIPHAGTESYYDRARRRFYDDEEPDLITSLKAVLLFYWWSPRPPSLVHRHSSWWWTSVVIRHAQQANWHRETEAELANPTPAVRTRRKIWWTAFARERLTAICQAKPCIIDPEDCNIPAPTLDDFPDLQDKTKAEVFIQWIKLCSIIGKTSKYLWTTSNSSSASFPVHVGKELIDWVRSLPPHLQLPIGSSHTTNYNRDVHLLHLPYLTLIIVLYLKRSSTQSLPQALPPATLAATCITRILKDVLVRSESRYLMAITCWYSGMAFIALLQASRNQSLKLGAEADLDVLDLTVKQLKTMWGTANMIESGFERLRASTGSQRSATDADSLGTGEVGRDGLPELQTGSDEAVMHDDIDWMNYFPFVTADTSAVAERILAQQSVDLFPFDDFGDNSMLQFQDLFEGIENWTDPKLFL